jgi:hypothetical protein
MFPRVKGVRHLGAYRLELLFTDGIKGELVAVDPEAGTLIWPNEVDLDPDVLYSLVTGQTIPELELA